MNTSPKTTTIKCEEQQNYSLSFWLSGLFQSVIGYVLQMLKKAISAYQLATAGYHVSLKEILNGKRILCGVVFILLAPISMVLYKLCDPDLANDQWYFANMYWYLWTIGPYVCFALWSVGAFLLFPTKSKFRYIAMLPPMSASVTALIHFTFFVTDYNSYHNISVLVVLSGCAVASGVLISADYLLYRKYHLKHGTITRMFGIIDAPGIDSDKKVEIMKVLREESKNFYARV